MNYEFYEKNNFERTESNDCVVKKETGYGGFTLKRKLWEGIYISVSSDELDRPSLYIEKHDNEGSFNIIKIDGNVIIDLIEILETTKNKL